MSQLAGKVLQFKITLRYIKPPIWRRILVPGDHSFWALHVAIQDAMGWFDYHLHEFEIFNPRKKALQLIGLPDDESQVGQATLPSWRAPIRKFISATNGRASYTYDFGDHWQHVVVLEKILPAEPDREYPVCVGGRRKCPPEDCGGVGGYDRFIEAVTDPSDDEHKELLEWVGGQYDAAAFDPGAVSFDDPAERLRLMMGDHGGEK